MSRSSALISILAENKNRRLCTKGKFGDEFSDESARGMPRSTNSKLSSFSTLFDFFRYASLSFLSECSLFFFNLLWAAPKGCFPIRSYPLCFSFYHNILKDDSAAQFSCEQRHTVEVFFLLAWLYFFSSHFNPTLSNTVNMKKYLS